MAKIQKNFRLEKSVIDILDDLTNFYNAHMPEFSVKKATTTDIISMLIIKEKEILKSKGYNLLK